MGNLSQTIANRKPKRRATTCPLFQRADGRWCKKIRGKHRYFGYDKKEALERYHREIGLLSQGLEPADREIGLRELFNRYLTAKERALTAGEIGARTLSDSAGTLKRVLTVLNDRLVSTLTPDDFARLKQALSKGHSVITVAGEVRRTKAAFNWACQEGLIPRVPTYGMDFKPAPKRAVRLAKSQRGAVMFEPSELRALVAAATSPMRAMIYLGINCALLPVDIARLTFEELDASYTWIHQARGKTGIDRQAALWQETSDALRAAVACRPKPAAREFESLVFLTENGLPVVRTRTPAKAKHDPKAALNATVINRVSADFRELQQACGVYRTGRGFGALRHVFLTVAESGRDFAAVATVMGHAIPGVSSVYREHIDRDRINGACQIVRHWLQPNAPSAPC